MSLAPPHRAESEEERLERCIRDLTTVSAIPAMCIGRSPREVIDIVLDAMPVALGWDLALVDLPGPPRERHARLGGVAPSDALFVRLERAIARSLDTGQIDLPAGPRFVLRADFPVHGGSGCLYAGRAVAMDARVDRTILRAAANVVGTTLDAARVLEAARRKDEFLAVLGHELRNPLAPIQTAVDLLARHPEAARERAVIERSAKHLARLVDDLLDISRVSRGQVELRREVVSLASVLEQASSMAEPLATRNQQSLRVDDAGELMLSGDPVRLAQAFGNVLVNACKFTPASGTIHVWVVPDGRDVRVGVTDDGQGIAPDHLRRIFEPFVQIDRPRDALRGGLGLGLAIAHDLVARHGGRLTAESAGPGKGSTFVFRLPLAERGQDGVHHAAAPAIAGVAGRRVLVVDDNTDLAELLAVALEVRGFETRVAHDAESALAAWETFHPHAAVLDLGLPGRDGYALARDIRSAFGLGAALVAATGYGQPRDAEQAAAAGFDRFLVKPVSVADVAAAIHACVAERERLLQSTPER